MEVTGALTPGPTHTILGMALLSPLCVTVASPILTFPSPCSDRFLTVISILGFFTYLLRYASIASVGTSSGSLFSFSVNSLCGFSPIISYPSLPSFTLTFYIFFYYFFDFVVLNVIVKCPVGPTSHTLVTLCICLSHPTSCICFSSSTNSSCPSSSRILATCMVRIRANMVTCLVAVCVCCLPSVWVSFGVASISTTSSIPGGATYLNFNVVFFLILLITSLIFPIWSCTLVYDRAKCSVSIHNFWGFQEMHVNVLKVMSVPTYDLEMHFNFIKDV